MIRYESSLKDEEYEIAYENFLMLQHQKDL